MGDMSELHAPKGPHRPGAERDPYLLARMQDTENELRHEQDEFEASADTRLDAIEAIQFSIGDYKEAAHNVETARWKLANGQAVSRTTYATLFALIGTTYGAGDGSTTFTLPDRRDRSGIGAGSTYSLGTNAGAATVNLEHAHDIEDHTHNINHDHLIATTSVEDDETTVGGGDTVTVADNDHTHTVDLPALGVTQSGPSSFVNTHNALSSTQSVVHPVTPVHYFIRVL